MACTSYPEGVVNLQLDCVCIGDGVNAAMCQCGFTATHTAEVFTELEMGWDIKLHQSRTEENVKNYVFFTLLLPLMEMSASSSSVIYQRRWNSITSNPADYIRNKTCYMDY